MKLLNLFSIGAVENLMGAVHSLSKIDWKMGKRLHWVSGLAKWCYHRKYDYTMANVSVKVSALELKWKRAKLNPFRKQQSH